MMRKEFSIDAEWRSQVPEPVFDERPEYNRLYERTWELAHDHLLDLPGMPQTPYMDEAFCDVRIWIWDSCFMSLFCKYAPNCFPGVETLNNFYLPLYGGRRLPQVIARNAPEWTGATIGEPAEIKICIADNPPLFAWAELQNALMTGDREHLRELLLEKRFLQKHFEWLENLTGPAWPPAAGTPTFWRKRAGGYLWEGGASGMDNTPRGRTGPSASMPRPNNPRMFWLDAISQQALSASCISALAGLIGEEELAAVWQGWFEAFRGTVNRSYWCEEDGFYYDIDGEDGSFYKVVTPASFWPVLAGIATPEQVGRMIAFAMTPERLGGPLPLLSLARNDADFNAENGCYWRGSLWLPTAYMAVKALEKYGEFELARDCARKILEHQYRTFAEYEPHTVWECYAPNAPEPARSCDENGRVVRPGFCGWSALGPISLYLENVIGLWEADAFARTLNWSLPEKVKGRIGVRNYRFGDVLADLIVENGMLTARSSRPFRLILNGTGLDIPGGECRILLRKR